MTGRPLAVFKDTGPSMLPLDLRILSLSTVDSLGHKDLTMNRNITFLLFIAITMVISVTCRPDAMLAPPGRPSEFRTPDQLRRYLKALNDYYAIVGRPRFGRSVGNQDLEQAFENKEDESGDF